MGAESWRLNGAPHLSPRSATSDCMFFPACHGLLGLHVLSRFDQVLSRFLMVKHGRWMEFEPASAQDIKKMGTKLLQALFSEPLI